MSKDDALRYFGRRVEYLLETCCAVESHNGVYYWPVVCPELLHSLSCCYPWHDLFLPTSSTPKTLPPASQPLSRQQHIQLLGAENPTLAVLAFNPYAVTSGKKLIVPKIEEFSKLLPLSSKKAYENNPNAWPTAPAARYLNRTKSSMFDLADPRMAFWYPSLSFGTNLYLTDIDSTLVALRDPQGHSVTRLNFDACRASKFLLYDSARYIDISAKDSQVCLSIRPPTRLQRLQISVQLVRSLVAVHVGVDIISTPFPVPPHGLRGIQVQGEAYQSQLSVNANVPIALSSCRSDLSYFRITSHRGQVRLGCRRHPSHFKMSHCHIRAGGAMAVRGELFVSASHFGFHAPQVGARCIVDSQHAMEEVFSGANVHCDDCSTVSANMVGTTSLSRLIRGVPDEQRATRRLLIVD